ncbi:MAG: hypothetical protein LBI60_03445, partial [Bacteroidales bacterium]|nr:hypothetical protein [Bacteroidales bacterium]
VLFLALLFSSCKKREGVYQPKKRISEIYIQEDGTKELLEKWTWSDKKLSKITAVEGSYSDGYSWSFQYNDKDQIEKIIHSEGDYYVFSYDNNFITKIALYTVDGVLVETYECEHTKKKITTVTNTYYGYESEYKYKSLPLTDQSKTTALCCFLPKPVINSLSNKYKKQIPIRKNGVEFIDVYQYTWDGDNIKSMFYSSEEYTIECTYKYDKKNNPFYHSFLQQEISNANIGTYTNYWTWNILHPKNNIIHEDILLGDGRRYETSYDITYEGKFPTEVRISAKDIEEILSIGIYFYTYN